MSLKAFLFNFNGVIINDEEIREKLIEDILLQENLRFDVDEYQKLCRGKSDRACLHCLLSNRGRIVAEDYINKLVQNKTEGYKKVCQEIEELPIYPGLTKFLDLLQTKKIIIAAVTSALPQEAEFILEKLEISSYFQEIFSEEVIQTSKPNPNIYLYAAKCLNLLPQECLALENTLIGIDAAKKAKMPVVGLANTYPLHLLQRQANWSVDDLEELELERVEKIFAENMLK